MKIGPQVEGRKVGFVFEKAVPGHSPMKLRIFTRLSTE